MKLTPLAVPTSRATANLLLSLLFAIIFSRGSAWGQGLSGDQLGTHDMSPSSMSALKGGVANACLYCHAPHGGMTAPTPLWNQQLSVQTYQMYGSSTYHQTGVQPPVGSPSKLCLSCHATIRIGSNHSRARPEEKCSHRRLSKTAKRIAVNISARGPVLAAIRGSARIANIADADAPRRRSTATVVTQATAPNHDRSAYPPIMKMA